MTDRKVVYAALKIGAIIIFVNFLSRLPAVTGLFAYEAEGSILLTILVTVVLNGAILLVVATMWFFPVTVARMLGLWSGDSQDTAEEERTRYAWLETALLAVIGIYLAVVGFADLAYYIGLHLSILANFGVASQLPSDTVGGYVASGVQIVLGLALAARSRHIPIFLRRLRRL